MQAIEIEALEDRAEFLDKACGDNRPLRKRLERLLNISSDQNLFLEPAHYQQLATEQNLLSQELIEEGQFLSELGKSINTLGEDYQLIEEIGRGSAGVVFRARQLSLNREVAVKVILGSALASPSERKRFQIEAEATAGLKHPNIVPVYEVGRFDNHDYYSMALMEGGTLGQSIESKFSASDAARIIIKVARTIHSAHRSGIIHRDLKPDNILMDKEGEPHISDFGLAFRLEQNQSLTITRAIMGTPHFMAPEQADPQIGSVTTSTDVYSLGAILYWLLVGEPPFRNESLLQLLQMVKSSPPRSLRTLDPAIDHDLETIALKCLEKQPSQRYESALALANDLQAWLDGRPIEACPPSTFQRAWKWTKREPAKALLASVTMLLAITLGIGGPIVALQQSKLRKEADEAAILAEQRSIAAESAKGRADRAARKNQALAYSYSTRLAAAVANTNSKSLASHGILRTFQPLQGQDDLRDWEWYYLYAEVYMEPRKLTGDGHEITSIRFSPGGRLFATARVGMRGSKLYDGSSAAGVRELRDESGTHHTFLWKPDGEQVVTISDAGSAKIWEAKSGQALAQIPTNVKVLSLAGWTSDGNLVGLTSDNRIRTWDLSNLKSVSEVSSVAVKIENLHKIALSPDGLYLAGISNTNDAFLWQSDRLEERPTFLSAHNGKVTDLAWHHDSRWLATLAEDQAMRIWEVPGGVRFMNVSKTEANLTALCWDPNGLRLMFAGENGYLWYSDPVTGELSGVMENQPAITALDWCAATHSFIVGFADGSIKMKRFGLPKRKQLLSQEPNGWSSIRWNTEGTVVGGPASDGELIYLDIRKGKVQETPDSLFDEDVAAEGWQPSGITPAPETFARHNSSDRLATGNSDGSVSVWDIKNQKRIAHFSTPSSTAPKISWHPSGTRIASAGDDKMLHIWDWKTGESPLSLRYGPKLVTDIAWSPNGMRLAASVQRGGITVWDATAGYLMNQYEDTRRDSP